MPNGRRRQTNTAHANRQRNLQRDLAVVDSIPVSVAPVVVEAMELSEVRAGEVKKLKGQIIGLKNKISNMEKQIEKGSGLKEQKRDLSETLKSSIEKVKKMKEDKEFWEQKFFKVNKKAKETNGELCEEMLKFNQFLAHVSNIMNGTNHDPDASFPELHAQLNGTDYDQLIKDIRFTNGKMKYISMVLRRCIETVDDEDVGVSFADGEDLFEIRYLGKKKDYKGECVKVDVRVTGDPKKDYERMFESDKKATEVIRQMRKKKSSEEIKEMMKMKQKKKFTESAVKNYSW